MAAEVAVKERKPFTREEVAALDEAIDSLQQTNDLINQVFPKMRVHNYSVEADEGGRELLARRLKESDIEAHLVKRAKELGGEVRKVQWVGRKNAPDRLVMLPWGYSRDHDKNYNLTVWVELKNPETIKTFPANAHERAQAREHDRMRKMGQRVEVVGTIGQVEELLS